MSEQSDSDETVLAEDLTVVSPRLPTDEQETDATIVSVRSVAGEPQIDDATIVSARPVLDRPPTDDATMVSSSRGDAVRDATPVSVDPWGDVPHIERGTSRTLAVVYGARPDSDMPLHEGADEVQLLLGPAPQPTEVRVRDGRESLPSLSKRDARRRVATLAAYPVVVAVSVAGLVWVATLVLG